MSTLLEMHHALCTEQRLPETRQKDILTALRYWAATYETTPDRLALTAEMETTYKERLRTYLTQRGKSGATIRNVIQSVGQCLRAVHQMPKAAPLPQVSTQRGRVQTAFDDMKARSPYKGHAWLKQSKYVLHQPVWPAEVTDAFERFLELSRHRHRPATVKNYIRDIRSLLGYLSLTGDERLERLHADARRKIDLPQYSGDRRLICRVPQTVAWEDCFRVDHLDSFVVWHSWRVHLPEEAKMLDRPPSIPSTLGRHVVKSFKEIADTMERTDDGRQIAAYLKTLRPARKMHDKAAAYHQFTFQELEDIAMALMHEARSMRISLEVGDRRVQYPGAFAAERFMTGLVLMMGWRVPLRIGNWVNMQLDTNLRQVNGVWHIHFESHELKIAEKRGLPNMFDIELAPEVVPYLEEYLHFWRPKLPLGNDPTERHVLLTRRGKGIETRNNLYMRLRQHVFRFSGKYLYPHLLRTIFMSNMFSTGVDLNTIAFTMNDSPLTLLPFYNEFQAGKHQLSLQDAYRRALSNGH